MKNTAQLQTLFALSNLRMARHRLLHRVPGCVCVCSAQRARVGQPWKGRETDLRGVEIDRNGRGSFMSRDSCAQRARCAGLRTPSQPFFLAKDTR